MCGQKSCPSRRRRRAAAAQQLLINKTIQDQVTTHRRDLVCAWLDYQKEFDTVPHDWLIESLKLAHVPEQLVRAIEVLASNWTTQLLLRSSEAAFETDEIKYQRGIFQGDSLSVLLFILALNPLSYLLQKMKGYTVGEPGHRNCNISHLFFVDDLKLYASTMSNMIDMLNLVTTFSTDIGMKFGESKCCYVVVKRGKALEKTDALIVNGLKLSPIGPHDSYRYLGIDECVEYDDALNKERVTAEYLKRARKIWSSQLSSFNKCIAHNAFAVPVIVPTFGILAWTKEELNLLDVKTRKILCLNGSFHVNGDVDRVYLPRDEGGRGLKSLFTSYQSRIVALHQHLTQAAPKNLYISKVLEHEMGGIVRVASEIMRLLDLPSTASTTPRCLGIAVTRAHSKARKEAYAGKVMHGYLAREMAKKSEVNLAQSVSWQKSKQMTSHFEGYAHAIQEQEISTKFLINKRMLDAGKTPSMDNKCRLCRQAQEDISHIIGGCSKMSVRYYIPLRHDAVARYIWNAVRRKNCQQRSFDKHDRFPMESEFIDVWQGREFWWNVPVKTCTRVKHNRPDIVAWDHQRKECAIIEISCPLDLNIAEKETEKENIYAPLIRNMQLMYPGYSFTFIPVVIGATGYVTKHLTNYLKQAGFNDQDLPQMVRKLQILAVTGTVKIAKTFMNFKL